MLLIYEKRLEKHNTSNIESLVAFANLISNQSRQFSNEVSSEKYYDDKNHQHIGGRGQNFQERGRGRGNFGGNHHQCQLCGKIGHMANKFWYRFDKDF